MNTLAGSHTLYLCYLGVREPLVQTQVLPYLRQLVAGGLEVSLLTFEPEYQSFVGSDEANSWRIRLRADGITWTARAYHKTPSLPATMYDIFAGGLSAAGLIKRNGISVVHARGHVAATMALFAKRLTGVKMIFDIRGFNPEEYVDAGIWPQDGLNYRLSKQMETRCLNGSDGYVVLTKKARDILFSTGPNAAKPVEVIPCCVDFTRFDMSVRSRRSEMRSQLGVEDRRVLIYVGQLGGWYLTAEMVDFVKTAYESDPSVFSIVLTQGTATVAEEMFRNAGLPDDAFRIEKRITQPDPIVSECRGPGAFIHQALLFEAGIITYKAGGVSGCRTGLLSQMPGLETWIRLWKPMRWASY